ncbi:MAG: hypothetical protein WDO70_09900 [Alphaproteobacteria bacterium]
MTHIENMLQQTPAEPIVAPVSFLSVTQSLTGRMWQARACDERIAEALAQRFTLPDILARAMAVRGITLETAADYLDPTLRLLMPDPSSFKDMDKAAARLVAAITAQESITIFGDYDVDGGTSTALLVRFLRACGAAPQLYIPDRTAEGYGPNAAAMERIAASSAKLVDLRRLRHDCARAAGPRARSWP